MWSGSGWTCQGRKSGRTKAFASAPATGPGKLNKSQREYRAKEIIAESGADSEQHFNAVQAVNLGTTFQQQADWWLQHIATRKRKPEFSGENELAERLCVPYQQDHNCCSDRAALRIRHSER
jgi:hypothetical protein